jgi:hypothetical protein
LDTHLLLTRSNACRASVKTNHPRSQAKTSTCVNYHNCRLSHSLIFAFSFFFIDADNNLINGTVLPPKCEIKSKVLMPYVVTYFSEAILAPFFAMTITTSVILKSLWSSRRNLKRQEPSSPSSLIIIRRITSRKRRERKYWINSVGLNVVFVLLMSPLMGSLVIPKTGNHEDVTKGGFRISREFGMT